jgi:hypothetical protein
MMQRTMKGSGSSRFGVRWLDAAFVLRQLCFLHDSRWSSGEKERHSQSGVKPPHSKEGGPTGGEQKSSRSRSAKLGENGTN